MFDLPVIFFFLLKTSTIDVWQIRLMSIRFNHLTVFIIVIAFRPNLKAFIDEKLLNSLNHDSVTIRRRYDDIIFVFFLITAGNRFQLFFHFLATLTFYWQERETSIQSSAIKQNVYSTFDHFPQDSICYFLYTIISHIRWNSTETISTATETTRTTKCIRWNKVFCCFGKIFQRRNKLCMFT